MTTRFEHMVQGAACAALLILVAGCAGPEPRPTPAGSEPALESDAANPKDGEGEAASKGESATDPDDKTAPDDKAASDDGADSVKPKRKLSAAELRAEANRVLDDWHDAAARADRNRYLDHFAPDAVFMGTDASERWDLAGFTVYVDEYFKPGGGWAYTPSDRHVLLGPGNDVAWFDEALENSGYGALRGTGALRRDGDTWLIVHYSMTFTIPNEVSRTVVDIVRANGS